MNKIEVPVSSVLYISLKSIRDIVKNEIYINIILHYWRFVRIITQRNPERMMEMAVKERKFVKANARQETKVEVTPRTKEERKHSN